MLCEIQKDITITLRKLSLLDAPSVHLTIKFVLVVIDLLPILQKSLDRAMFLCIIVLEVRSSDVTASTGIVNIRKFFKL